MVMSAANAIAFAMPGGESSSGPIRRRPIDLVHLAKQTMDDRLVEQEVLALFVQQAALVRDGMVHGDSQERLRLAHGLKGSARGIGAFAIAECMEAIEQNPFDEKALKRLPELVDEARDFIAAISR